MQGVNGVMFPLIMGHFNFDIALSYFFNLEVFRVDIEISEVVYKLLL